MYFLIYIKIDKTLNTETIFWKNMHIRKHFMHYTLNKKRLYCLWGKIRGFIEDKMYLVMLFSSKVSSWPFRFVLMLTYVILRELREGNFLLQTEMLFCVIKQNTVWYVDSSSVSSSHLNSATSSFFFHVFLFYFKNIYFFIFSSPIW